VLVSSAWRRRLLPRILGGRVLRLLMRGTHVMMLHTRRDYFNNRLGLGKTLVLLNEALVDLG
jgi:hypothetical protein